MVSFAPEKSEDPPPPRPLGSYSPIGCVSQRRPARRRSTSRSPWRSAPSGRDWPAEHRRETEPSARRTTPHPQWHAGRRPPGSHWDPLGVRTAATASWREHTLSPAGEPAVRVDPWFGGRPRRLRVTSRAASLANSSPGKRFRARHCVWPPARATRSSGARADPAATGRMGRPALGTSPSIITAATPVAPRALHGRRRVGWAFHQAHEGKPGAVAPGQQRRQRLLLFRVGRQPVRPAHHEAVHRRAAQNLQYGGVEPALQDLFGLRGEALLLLTLADVQRTGQPAHGNPSIQGGHFSSPLPRGAVPSGGPPGAPPRCPPLAPGPPKPAWPLVAQGLEVESDFLDGSADHLNLAQIAGSDAELFGQPQLVVAPLKRRRHPFAPWDRSSSRP